MGGIIAIDGSKSGDITKTGELWRTDGMVGKASPLLIDGRLYAFDDGAKLYILDAASGQPIGKKTGIKLIGTRLRSSPIYADGKIYACSETAWHVLEPTADGAKIVNRLRMSAEDEIYGAPIISHGKLYLPTMEQIYCLGKPGAKPAATPRPAPPKETPVAQNDPPAIVQVVPAEVLLKPGDTQKFTVRLFNARGQLLKESPATFTLAGPGEIAPDGTFHAASAAAHAATIVTAKVGDLAGKARIRVVPPLPWKFDFASGEIPVTWVGARYRHQQRHHRPYRLHWQNIVFAFYHF
jgi:hypothetical protein